MSTVLAYGVRPSDYMSLECLKCALEENRVDLVTHWISQDRYRCVEDGRMQGKGEERGDVCCIVEKICIILF